MLLLLSPSKKIDFESRLEEFEAEQPYFKKEIGELIKILNNKKKSEIKNLMSLSDNLAELNFHRYQNFKPSFNLKNSKQAIFAFKGDVYDGLDIQTLNKKEINSAKNKIAVLSGLYGLLKPFDLIQPYRLEMGTSLKNNNGANLYNFWGNKIASKINELESDYLINLASNEYFKAVNKKELKSKLINIVFKEDKNNKISTIGIYAKKARGMMARFTLKENINNPDELKNFNYSGYKFIPKMSDSNNLTFIRKHD